MGLQFVQAQSSHHPKISLLPPRLSPPPLKDHLQLILPVSSIPSAAKCSLKSLGLTSLRFSSHGGSGILPVSASPSAAKCSLKSLGLTSLRFSSHGGSGLTMKRRVFKVVVASSNVDAPLWDGWAPDNSSAAPSFSDILWPSAGAFAAMAILGKFDELLAPRGIAMTIAPLGSVCAVLFATPSSPAARKYNMFIAQIACAAIGVLAFSIFGPGWLARSASLAASIAFMISTRSTHPPAASLPLFFVDGVKFHHLNFWFALFPGATSCILLSLIQEIVRYLKQNYKF